MQVHGKKDKADKDSKTATKESAMDTASMESSATADSSHKVDGTNSDTTQALGAPPGTTTNLDTTQANGGTPSEVVRNNKPRAYTEEEMQAGNPGFQAFKQLGQNICYPCVMGSTSVYGLGMHCVDRVRRKYG